MIDYNLIKNKIKELDENKDVSLDNDEIVLFYEHIEYYEKNKNKETFDEELIDSIYQILSMNIYFFDDFPYVIEYLFKNSNTVPLYIFIEMKGYFEDLENREKAKETHKYLYRINYIIANREFYMGGLHGGFELVNMLFEIDESILYMAKYSLKENDPLLAFKYLLRFRRDELTQKWHHERTNLKTKDINKLFIKIFNGMNNI